MIFALVAVFFILGFGTAIIGSSDLKSSKASIDRFFRTIRLAFESLSSSPRLTADGIEFAGNAQENSERGRKSLLTRYIESVLPGRRELTFNSEHNLKKSTK